MHVLIKFVCVCMCVFVVGGRDRLERGVRETDNRGDMKTGVLKRADTVTLTHTLIKESHREQWQFGDQQE